MVADPQNHSLSHSYLMSPFKPNAVCVMPTVKQEQEIKRAWIKTPTTRQSGAHHPSRPIAPKAKHPQLASGLLLLCSHWVSSPLYDLALRPSTSIRNIKTTIRQQGQLGLLQSCRDVNHAPLHPSRTLTRVGTTAHDYHSWWCNFRYASENRSDRFVPHHT